MLCGGQMTTPALADMLKRGSGARSEAPIRIDSEGTWLRLREWPTWAMIACCYALWAAALAWHQVLGPLGFAVIGGYAIALHASLQHEALHGHPTRSAAWNEALVFLPLNLLLPYRRFRETHLKHHRDERLTDPYDDPESWYLAEGDWRRASPVMRALLSVNATLAGRLLFGPWLSVYGLCRADWREVWAVETAPTRRRRLVGAWARHAVGATLATALIVGVAGVHPLFYLLCGVWPGYALLMLRTYAEHRAAERPGERTAIVEAEPILGLLFLNNNLHAVHHAHPTVPWYRLPGIWRRQRDQVLAANGGYFINGYRAVLWRWLLRRREPVAHPMMRRRG